ncbi:MAG: hypothetical protein IPJ20_23485 [Flammeovirgaceae bacterium]|nr:hypothetical protein [Flammeovirgaceae bacterium]
MTALLVPYWQATNGSVQSSSKSGTTYKAVVYWYNAEQEPFLYGNGSLWLQKVLQ